MSNSMRRGLQRLPLAIAVVAVLQVPSAMAEQPEMTAETSKLQSNEQGDPGKTKDLDAVSVTGSLLRRPEYETTSPVQVISIEKGKMAGRFDTADFIQGASAAAGSTQINNQFGGFVVEGGTGVQTVSLRGLGANRTLILLDGQRPGPAGTRGQVGAFDLNVIPQAVLKKIEIVKDGSSSIYGSDAVAGVVNVITRKDIERPELSYGMSIPQHGGGEQFSASVASGWNFENGSIIAAAQWDRLNALTYGDRDFFSCKQDRVWGTDGQRIDREDRSILAGSDLAGCSNLYANTILQSGTSTRYVPSTDGSTSGPFPGYKPRPNPTQTYANSEQAYYEDVNNFDFWDSAEVINQRERASLYVATDFGFDNVNWKTQWLYNRRETKTHGYRQFFPVVENESDGNLYQPIMPFLYEQEIIVDYIYAATKLDGAFKSTDSWSWEVNANYSRSDGDYSSLGIDTRRTGDLGEPNSGTAVVDYFDAGFLSGERMGELVDAIGMWSTGNTVYDQASVNAIFAGNLFTLPAGDVGAAIGAEYRYYSIDDQPSEAAQQGYLWGSSSAQVTKGDDRVKEFFTEFDVPLLKAKPGIESLSVNLSGRIFKYDSVEDSDKVWKVGMNWQIIPSLRVRGSIGTSYRAPGLYELYLGNQTAYQSQTIIDPCIEWQDSNNTKLRANCAAAGIPADYAGTGSSATIYSSGGDGELEPETSRAKTLGIIFTPTFADLSIAIDYFDYDVRGQITQLDSSEIVYGCYGATVYPNNYCDQMVRNSPSDPDAPNSIREVHSVYLNVNRQRTRGYDLQVNYDKEFSFGNLSLESQFTYTIEDREQLFDSASASGQSTSNLVGYIGRPKLVGSVDTSLKRGDWTYSYRVTYTGSTKDLDLDETYTYQGYQNAHRDIRAGWVIYHDIGIKYDAADWSVMAGVRNLFDREPATMSSSTGYSLYGNVPVSASQYDWYGRTFFVNLGYKF